MIYILHLYTTEDQVHPEELTNIILGALSDWMGNDPSFYPADDPADTGLYYNAAPLDNEYYADDVFSIGIVTDVAESTLQRAIDNLMEHDDIVAYDYELSN